MDNTQMNELGTVGASTASMAATGSMAGPWGTAIGAVVGAGVGVYQVSQNRKKLADDKLKNRKAVEADRISQGLNAYNPNDYATPTPYYAYGGSLIPTSSQSQLAIGNTHEQGGIEIPQGTIENGEVINNDQVFSNRIILNNGITVADVAKIHSKILGNLEKKSKDLKDVYQVNANVRKQGIIKSQLNQLFQQQEQIKQSLTI